MLNNDDKIWLDTIAGKNVPEDANPDTVAEAQALRDAFHAEEQLQKLMLRIQPEPKPILMDKLRLWWASNTMTPVLVPLVVVVSFVGLLVVKMTPDSNHTDLKPKSELKIQPANATEEIIENYSRNPKQTAEQLKQEFIAAGASVELTSKQNSYQLDIKLPTSASDKLLSLCDRIGINPNNKSARIIVKLAE